MALTDDQADAVSKLLNARNQLTVPYTLERVLKYSHNYICEYSDVGEVIACVEVKPVQWYQCEVLHLTVAEGYERQGYARSLLSKAELAARKRNARVAQCTIRVDNERSRKLFEAAEFRVVGIFFNEISGNNVMILEKILVPPR